MTKDELKKATGQELIDARNYCGVDGYYRDYLENVNAEMLKRFNRLAELERENAELRIKNTNAILTGLEMLVAKDSHRDRANKTQDKFIKAKELLAKWVELYKPKLEGYSIPPIQEQTMQFLKETNND